MFDDTIISILVNEPKNTPLKSVLADVQEYDNEIDIDNFKITVNKRLFIDYLEPLIKVNTNVKINNEVLRVVKVKTYTDYQEVFVKDVKDVEINGIDKSVIIEDSPDKIIDYKTIITGFNISSGDLIEYQSEKWLIVGEVEQGKNSYRGTIRKIQHNIKVKFADEIYNMPSIIEDKIQNTTDGKVMSIVDGKIEILTQLNKISKKIRTDWQFITMGNKWQVEGFSYCNKGLYKIYCTKEMINTTTDDIENEIADNPSGKDTFMNDIYTLEINLDNNNNIKVGQTLQLNVVAKKNSIEDKAPKFTYKSNNTNVVEINKNGLITGIGEGTTKITVKYINAEKVIAINVVKVNYSIELITIDSKLKPNKILQIKAKYLKDGVEDLNPHIDYSSSNNNVVEVNSIGLITARAEGVATITIKYQDIEKYIKIEVKNVQEPPKIEILDEEEGTFTVDSLFDKTFKAKYLVNNMEDKTAKITFTLKNKEIKNREPLAVIKSFTNNSCVISANKKVNFGYIVLTASLIDNSLSVAKEILVKNPFT